MVDNMEFTGYVRVWGYLYLQKDSLKSWSHNPTAFANEVKGWIYGDTLTLYSEIIQQKNINFIFYPIDKKQQFSKSLVTQIYPIDLIEENIGRGSYSQISSTDKDWLLSEIHTQQSFYIESGAACEYTVLYYNEPDNEAIALVNKVEAELRKEALTGTSAYEVWRS